MLDPLLQLTLLAQAASAPALPWGARALAFGGLVVGLILWLRGRSLLKVLYGLAFASAVGALGFFGPVSVGLDINPNVGLVAGALLGVLVGLAAFKFSMAATLALVLAVVAPIAAAVVLTFTPAPIADDETAHAIEQQFTDTYQRAADEYGAIRDQIDALDSASDNLPRPEVAGISPEEQSAAEELIRSAAEEVRGFVTQLLRDAGHRLDGMTTSQRATVLGSSLLGAAVGFLLGLVFSDRTAAVAAAFVGAALWLPSGAYLLDYAGAPGLQFLPSSASGWFFGWLAISALGSALQWTRRKPKADNSSAN